ncbi:hypothetical protein L1987_57522 [Smallanthus sonchifolius]|uniref:Uncharacterized protein n=1 Tax=Smallanthus sonchifolius TaxID=185202 RepID=A0ACB9DD96_9ASTR|nr:hypothetical protein L1987_57522 [Smallanthus sonchifolius]
MAKRDVGLKDGDADAVVDDESDKSKFHVKEVVKMMLGTEKEKIRASDIPKSADGFGGKDLGQGLSEELQRKESESLAKIIAKETLTKPPSKFSMVVGDSATRVRLSYPLLVGWNEDNFCRPFVPNCSVVQGTRFINPAVYKEWLL